MHIVCQCFHTYAFLVLVVLCMRLFRAYYVTKRLHCLCADMLRCRTWQISHLSVLGWTGAKLSSNVSTFGWAVGNAITGPSGFSFYSNRLWLLTHCALLVWHWCPWMSVFEKCLFFVESLDIVAVLAFVKSEKTQLLLHNVSNPTYQDTENFTLLIAREACFQLPFFQRLSVAKLNK